MQRLPELKCKKILLTHLGEEMLHNRHKIQPDCAEDGQILL